MDGKITLPYSEYAVANKLNNLVKKHGCSIYVPTSRQQKGIDLIIHRNNTKNIVRIQIKSSRTYYGKQKSKYSYYLWLKSFFQKYKRNTADFYIIYGLYAEPNTKEKITTKKKIWKEVFLCYNDKEMYSLLKKARTKIGKKIDSFFGYGFNSSNEVYLDRGFTSIKNKDASQNILDIRINDILELLDTRM